MATVTYAVTPGGIEESSRGGSSTFVGEVTIDEETSIVLSAQLSEELADETLAHGLAFVAVKESGTADHGYVLLLNEQMQPLKQVPVYLRDVFAGPDSKLVEGATDNSGVADFGDAVADSANASKTLAYIPHVVRSSKGEQAGAISFQFPKTPGAGIFGSVRAEGELVDSVDIKDGNEHTLGTISLSDLSDIDRQGTWMVFATASTELPEADVGGCTTAAGSGATTDTSCSID